MTAYEISDAVSAAKAKNALHLMRLYKAGEALAYNTAALCLTAFNAPQRFPKTMDGAFIRKGAAGGGSADFAIIAERINREMEQRNGGNEADDR